MKPNPEPSVRKGRILVIDDETNMRHMLTVLLENAGYETESAEDGKIAIRMIEKEEYDFILCDIRMPRMGGIEFLDISKKRLNDTPVIMMSAYGSIDSAVEAMKHGAYDYISKPFKPDEILIALEKADEKIGLKRENSQLKEKIRRIRNSYSFGKMIGKSPVIKDVFSLAEKAARFNSTVLITGESGTGKELVARAIHEKSDRLEKEFVALNCAGIPDTLLESELFGHVRGAFTGADRDQKGLFAEAEGGTIFLDEIGDLPFTLQAKLLRVLQENEIRRVGDSRSKHVDIRVIAATSKDMEDAVAKGEIRQDLYYRLNVIRIQMPSLRDWAEDIPLLCHHFIRMFNEKFGKEITGLSQEALKRLVGYPWPGNVRELENTIERAVVMADDNILGVEDLPDRFAQTDSPPPEMQGGALGTKSLSIKEAKKNLEKNLIIMALRQTEGNRTKASRLLEISHPSLLSKMKEYGIDL